MIWNYDSCNFVLYFCHSNPSIIASAIQNVVTAITDIILNSFTKFIGAVTSSGLGGMMKNTAVIKTA